MPVSDIPVAPAMRRRAWSLGRKIKEDPRGSARPRGARGAAAMSRRKGAVEAGTEDETETMISPAN